MRRRRQLQFEFSREQTTSRPCESNQDHRPGTAGVPPARAQPNQEHCCEPLEELELVLLDAGRRGRLRSQDDGL